MPAFMSAPAELATLTAADAEATAHLLHRALVNWYQTRLGQGARFGDSHEPFRLFPEVYEALDPGEGLTARDAETNTLLGVCFTHERDTHLGIGIVAMMAYDPKRDVGLRALDASHLFEPSTTRIGIRRNSYLRGYMYDFIEMFAPHLTRKVVMAAMHVKD